MFAIKFLSQRTKPLGKFSTRSFARLEWANQTRVALTALGLAGCVIAFRLAGLLQGWELATLDQFLQLRPTEPIDDRIIIVGITEADLRAVGMHPIPDRVMATLLTKVQAAQPRAIGLDLYRDLPVESGHADLLEAYRQMPNLVGIWRIADGESLEVPAPPILGERNQVGFNNVVHDQDDKVRRAMLYWKPKNAPKARASFALVLALKYLEGYGIKPVSAEDPSHSLKLGDAIFRRLTADDGAYVRADSGGYQILINPRGGANTFRFVSLIDILNDRVSPEMLRDRIVLIGYTAVSINDFVYNSYSSSLFRAPQTVSGIELQANIISQLISTTQNQRPLISTWSEWAECLWIGLWAWLTASLCARVPSLRKFLLFWILGLTGLVGGSYLLLTVGYWIPVVPPLLSSGAAAIAAIAHQARLQEELRRSKDFLNSIIDTIPDPVFVKDKTHRWIVLNAAYANFLGYSLDELAEQSDYTVFSEKEAHQFRQHDDSVFKTQQSHQNEETFTDRAGVAHTIETKRSLHKDAAGNLFLVGVIRDITARKQMENDLKRTTVELALSNAELLRSTTQLNHLANHDALTGLPNRNLFQERLAQAIARSQQTDELIGILFADLDGFKHINDSLGHDIGDFLLKAVAQRLVGCLRGSDTIARIGGDEFIIILPAIPSAEDAERVAEKLLSTLAQPFAIREHRISVTSSIGISIYPTNANDADELIKSADVAMYQAKQAGKSRYRFAQNQQNWASLPVSQP
jgi:diguanylate cyclase (GGDEF)-like protein/PAS domain S-box-containing protein